MSNVENIIKDKHKQCFQVTVQLPGGGEKVFSTETYNEDVIMDRLAAMYPGQELDVTRKVIDRKSGI